LIDTNSKVKGRKLPGKSAKYELDWDAYYRHDAINDFVDELARTHDFAESVVIGKTYEGREMKVLRTNKAGEGAPNVWIEAGN
jgi:murein tripeptide amidase MpaA